MKHRKFVTMLFLLLVLALAAMGVAYGMWAEALWIRGAVYTGEVDVALSLEGVWDVEEKDVGICDAWLSQWDPGYLDVGDGPNRIDILVENAYPSYECHVKFNVENIGTIPVHFVFTGPEGNLPPEAIEFLCSCPDWNQLQLHPGEIEYCEMVIHFTNDTPGMGENGCYQFGYDFIAHQYNEPW